MGITRKQLYVYIALAFVVVALGVRYVLAAHAQASGSPGQLIGTPSPQASGATGQAGDGTQAGDGAGTSASGGVASGSSTAQPIVVYICGAVVQPGVYDLESGARVADLLKCAGGASAKADLSAVNLAAKLSDGQQIVVPKRGAVGVAAVGSATGSAVGSAGTGAADGGSATAIVNINTATSVELDALQGVGPATAQKIIDYRTANGPFKTIEELKNVSGIGDAKFAALKPYVTVQ
jgi:competence protein ComEA